jgi:hypothetical protein
VNHGQDAHATDEKEVVWSSLLSADAVLGNIHPFYQSNKSGQSNLQNVL